MTLALDTHACIAAMRGHPRVLQQLLSVAPNDCGISTVTLYELFSGVESCRQPDVERQKVATFARPLRLLPFDLDAAHHTARIRRHLEQRGKLIGPYDLMLAGQAISLGVTLVTRNTREFSRVPGRPVDDGQV